MLLDDVLLPDEDLLDLAPEEPTMKAPEQPPLGLKLTKSASLVDLINAGQSADHQEHAGDVTTSIQGFLSTASEEISTQAHACSNSKNGMG